MSNNRAVVSIIEKHTIAMLAELRDLMDDARTSPRGEAREPEDLPQLDWHEVQRLTGQTYRWPDKNGGLETYDPFIVYTSGGLTLAVARLTNERERDQTWVFRMSDDLKHKRPLTPFIAGDTYDDKGEMISLIRGKGETGRQMFGPGDQLPRGYDQLRVEIHRDRKAGGFNKYCVVAHKDDVESMLLHCALQARLRGL